MSWDTSGFDAAVALVRAALPAAVERRLGEQAQDLLAGAQGASDFPYDTGSLQHSGAVSEVAWDGSAATVTVSFGGDSGGYPHDPVDYAEEVHEGTPQMAARPYLATPLEGSGPQDVQAAAEAVLSDLAEAWRS